LPVVAVVFDFDDTLVPDSTSLLLESYGIDANDFWTNRVRALTDQGYDPPLAYLRLLLDEVGPGKRLGPLSNAGLRAFGATLDGKFFPGLPEFFTDARRAASEVHRDYSVEFYIISGGLEDVILGSSVVRDHITGVYGCQLDEDENGLVRYVKRCITFTEKTRYLFEVNKGIEPNESKTQPQLVNREVPEERRRVPFERMIYVGDGLTDIPCFSLLRSMRGTTFGVFDQTQQSARQAYSAFLQAGRVLSMHFPRYRPDDELGSVLRAAVSQICTADIVKRSQT
jgi:phosphoserine phosphatase